MRSQSDVWRRCGALLVVGAVGACQSIPEDYPIRKESLALSQERRAELRLAMDQRFGTPKALRVPDVLDLAPADVIAGQAAFKDLCANCHGVLGDGDGLVVDDRGGARDFRRGVFKFTSTGTPTPTHEDIERRVLEGLPGTRMPPFEDEPPQALDAAIAYLKFVAQRGVVERRLIVELEDEDIAAEDSINSLLEEIGEDWRRADDRVLTPKTLFSPASAAQVEEGRLLFLSEQAQCFDCHGPEADGEGQRAGELKDDWGQTIEAADLTEGEFRGGARPIDLYRRIAGGIHGTPMPAMRSALSEDEIWAIVHYIRSLSTED